MARWFRLHRPDHLNEGEEDEPERPDKAPDAFVCGGFDGNVGGYPVNGKLPRAFIPYGAGYIQGGTDVGTTEFTASYRRGLASKNLVTRIDHKKAGTAPVELVRANIYQDFYNVSWQMCLGAPHIGVRDRFGKHIEFPEPVQTTAMVRLKATGTSTPAICNSFTNSRLYEGEFLGAWPTPNGTVTPPSLPDIDSAEVYDCLILIANAPTGAQKYLEDDGVANSFNWHIGHLFDLYERSGVGVTRIYMIEHPPRLFTCTIDETFPQSTSSWIDDDNSVVLTIDNSGGQTVSINNSALLLRQDTSGPELTVQYFSGGTVSIYSPSGRIPTGNVSEYIVSAEGMIMAQNQGTSGS